MSLSEESRIRKGRGAGYNPPNRFAATRSDTVDDGWWRETSDHPLTTTVREEASKSALSWNRSPDLPFDRSINPYRGCEHGCIYCYARPTHAYWDMSPGIDFETRLIARTGLVDRLRAELCQKDYRCQPINLSGNTDCYQPLEAERGTTRALLELLFECRHPVTIVTKSALILGDRDLLAEMASQNLVQVFISLTTLDNDLKRHLEPRTAAPVARLRAMRELSQAGVPVGVLAAPVIPALTDHELEDILSAARDAGARTAGWVLLRLPHEVAPLFEDWLTQHYPDRAKKVLSIVRDSRGGRNNDPRFGHRMRGEGVFADLLAQRFDRACRQLGLNAHGRQALDCSRFRAPHRQGDLFQ